MTWRLFRVGNISTVNSYVGGINYGIAWPAGRPLEAALYFLLPLQGLLPVLGAEAVGPLGGLQVEEAFLVRLLGGAGQRASFAHTPNL